MKCEIDDKYSNSSYLLFLSKCLFKEGRLLWLKRALNTDQQTIQGICYFYEFSDRIEIAEFVNYVLIQVIPTHAEKSE